MVLPTYVLITPVRNEVEFIELTLQSVVAQTVRPLRWVIVSDGSTDGTDEIVQRYTVEHPWIELVRADANGNRNFAGKVNAFNAGYGRLRSLQYDVIGNLDGDTSFESDYFSFLLQKLAEDTRLGVVGTCYVEDSNLTYNYRFASTDDVPGNCQLFRRACFEKIGGYTPVETGAVDTIAVLAARMYGWTTKTFTEKSTVHHRKSGQADRGALMVKFRTGIKDYCVGSHPLWELFKTVYWVTRKPLIMGGVMLGAGYFWALIQRRKRPISVALVSFHQTEQMKRLKYLGARALSGVV
jgi:glycosyltransferase involved in cell wall biosynthesis